MKRFFIFFLVLILSLMCCACSQNTKIPSEKLQIVTTLFPQYDFAREIAGDKADVMLLAPAGADGHTYEPTPAEIIRITESDMFIYTGKQMEVWAEKIIASVNTENLKVVDVSENIDLKQEGHSGHPDPHIWTEPNNAKIMVDNITKALCDIDVENKDYYSARADEYKLKLDELDKSFAQTVANAKTNKMIFGDSFAFLYFADRYGIEHKAAFDSCSSEAEPGANIIMQIMEDIRENGISAVYYSETSNKKVPETIAQEMGIQTLLFHSCHTVTKEEIDAGVSYLELMQQNLVNLEKGLN